MGKKYKFRVVRGIHSEGYVTDERGRKKSKVYRMGDVVETDTDLRHMNSRGAIKFEPVGSTEHPSPLKESPVAVADTSGKTLQEMTLAELREVANAEELDVEGLTKKEIIASIAGVSDGGAA